MASIVGDDKTTSAVRETISPAKPLMTADNSKTDQSNDIATLAKPLTTAENDANTAQSNDTTTTANKPAVKAEQSNNIIAQSKTVLSADDTKINNITTAPTKPLTTTTTVDTETDKDKAQSNDTQSKSPSAQSIVTTDSNLKTKQSNNMNDTTTTAVPTVVQTANTDAKTNQLDEVTLEPKSTVNMHVTKTEQSIDITKSSEPIIMATDGTKNDQPSDANTKSNLTTDATMNEQTNDSKDSTKPLITTDNDINKTKVIDTSPPSQPTNTFKDSNIETKQSDDKSSEESTKLSNEHPGVSNEAIEAVKIVETILDSITSPSKSIKYDSNCINTTEKKETSIDKMPTQVASAVKNASSNDESASKELLEKGSEESHISTIDAEPVVSNNQSTPMEIDSQKNTDTCSKQNGPIFVPIPANSTSDSTATIDTVTLKKTETSTTSSTTSTLTSEAAINQETDEDKSHDTPKKDIESVIGHSPIVPKTDSSSKRKRRSSHLVSDSESVPSEGGRSKRARTKTQLFQSPAGIATRNNRSTSQSDIDETLSEKSKDESPKKTVEYEKHQILAVRSESGFYLCRTAQGSRKIGDLKIEWLDSDDNKHYTLTKHFDKVTQASVLAELHLPKLKLPDKQRSRTYILDEDDRKIIERALNDSLKIGKEKLEPDQKNVKTNDSTEETTTRRRRTPRNS